MYHTVYKVTNLINGKIYIGKHNTEFLYDSYRGTGTRIKRAIKKYGKENFSIEYLFFGFSEQDAYDFEESIVTKDFIKRNDVYNSRIGGNSPFTLDTSALSRISESNKNKITCIELDSGKYVSITKKKFYENRALYKTHNEGKEVSDNLKERIRKTLIGRKRSLESRKLQSETNSGRSMGETHRTKMKKLKTKLYIFTNPLGECIWWYGRLDIFCNSNNISLDKISKNLNKGIIGKALRKDSSQNVINTEGWSVTRC